MYYVFAKENAGKYLDFTKMDRDYTIINGEMWDKFNMTVWVTGQESRIEWKKSFTPDVAAQYDIIESQLNTKELKNSGIVDTITDVKLGKMEDTNAKEIKAGMDAFLQVYNANTRDYDKAFDVISKMPMIWEYADKVNNMDPALQWKARLYMVNVMASMFATAKEITRAQEEWGKIMWWSWLGKDIDLKNKSTKKDLLPGGIAAAERLWILKWGRTADFSGFDNNLQKYLAIREIFDVPYVGGKKLGSRYEGQMAEYEKMWISGLITKDQYLDMIMNMGETTMVNNIVGTGVIAHKSLGASEKWLHGVLGSADYLATGTLSVDGDKKASMLNALNEQWLLEGSKMQIISMLEANGVSGNVAAIVEQLVTTWVYNDGVINLTLWGDFMYGLTTWADISLMIANMTVSGTVNGISVSMIIDASIWGSVTTGAIYNGWSYDTTNTFGVTYTHPIQEESEVGETDETEETEETDETGETWETWETDETDETDETGDTWETDETGETGDTGETDETGETGETDETDETGETGETGETDETDETGETLGTWDDEWDGDGEWGPGTGPGTGL